MKRSILCTGILVALFGFVHASLAEDNPAPFRANISPGPTSSFQKGQWEATFNNGLLFSPVIVDSGRPTVDYTYSGLEFGRMLSTPDGDAWYRGNFELGGEFFGGGIFEGRGSYLAGTGLFLRYNFVQEGWRFIPYAQIDLGAVFTDVDRRLQGENFNFTEQFALGGRYFISPQWSLNLELRFQHISNAGLASPNAGVNALGPMLSLSYFF
jgi:hypothetical protein